jgi:diacylglycerol O-acyltransferase / wax synthase
MIQTHYERLTALDTTFLAVESRRAHMHVGSVSLFDAHPLTTDTGGLDFERLERAIRQMVQRTPRLRQKLWWPAGGPAVWIDDAHFRFSYHVRQSALPLPGTLRQLKRTAARVLSQSLDLAKPLWEIWLIEGVEGQRFAMIAKLHHCLADGISAREILLGFMSPTPGQPEPKVDTWRPRPAPTALQLHLEEAQRRLTRSRDLACAASRWLWSPPRGESAGGEGPRWTEVLASWTRTASRTPFNQEIGPHRRFDWTTCDLATARRIGMGSGGKVNDVVLAVVTGAVRRFLLQRGLTVDDLEFRALVPVSVRDGSRVENPGNRVSNMLVTLPLAEADPRRRLARIIEATGITKASRQSEIGDLLLQFADCAGWFVPPKLARRITRRRVVNLVVTNVPGPSAPLYLVESQMLETYPVLPLAETQALGIALNSYNGALYWGFLADRDALPGLHEFVAAIDQEIEALA